MQDINADLMFVGADGIDAVNVLRPLMKAIRLAGRWSQPQISDCRSRFIEI